MPGGRGTFRYSVPDYKQAVNHKRAVKGALASCCVLRAVW